MSECIKLNEGNVDVYEREVVVLRELIAAAMGRLHQMRKQCERGYASSEDFENALDAYGVIRERADELDQLGFEFRWSSVPDAGVDEYIGLEWIQDDISPRERGFDIAC